MILPVVSLALGVFALDYPHYDGRIVGGDDAAISDYPYQISLQLEESHVCGGAILSRNTIVTASHCVFGVEERTVSIRAGSSILERGGVLYKVSKIHTHPQFDEISMDYDIAVLEVADNITFGKEVDMIRPVDGDFEPLEGLQGVITGWGVISEDGPLPSILQKASVPIVAQSDCKEAYSGFSITERMFCAGVLKRGGKDSCQGDSGGPLVVDGRLAGIVSWGFGCARPSYPGVYTNVAAMRDFIAKFISL